MTRSGELVRDFYDFISRPEGKRGEFYAPVLLLNDYYHGNWEWKRKPRWNVWYLYPYEESDYMLKSVIDIIDPPTGSFAKMKEYSNGMRNSKYADICDTFFANAPTGVITQAELGKYPVVFLMGAIRNTPGLSEALQEYVRKGGTLIINAAQMALLPENFAGVKLSRTRINSGRMQIHKVTLAEQAQVALGVGEQRAQSAGAYGIQHIQPALGKEVLRQFNQDEILIVCRRS